MDLLAYNCIKEILVRKGITNKSLAEHLGVKQETVSNWCTNKTQPSIQTLFIIAEFLDVEATDLLASRSDLNRMRKIKK